MTERPIVIDPYILLERESITDKKLLGLIDEKNPEAIIGIPEFPDIVYLRIQPLKTTGFGWGLTVVQSELGIYYDTTSHELIDLEGREDGEIVPTKFMFSMEKLSQMRDQA